MTKLLKILGLILSVILFVYVSLPNPNFPSAPPNSDQSDEPADSESPLRRAYFTNLTREEVINHYQREFKLYLVGYEVKLPTLRLNYPPEEAQTIIRDQTRSTYLEELVHPFRESVFINGFEPQSEKDTILIKGNQWNQKIIVRYVPSSVWFRLVVGCFTLVLVYLLVREYSYAKRSH